MTGLYPLKLQPVLKNKMWGRQDLAPYFAPGSAPVGEAWLHFEESRIENGAWAGRALREVLADATAELMGAAYEPSTHRRISLEDNGSRRNGPRELYFPLLTKILFTARNLSVQVHPDDNYALSTEGGPGKTEAWYVLDAKPGARVAVGLREPLEREALRAAALSGEIEGHLNWMDVARGDTLLVPAGTLHSIGEGLILFEVQQNSDLTYRFFDFGRLDAQGRPRDLHLDRALDVVIQHESAGHRRPEELPHDTMNVERLIACEYFVLDRLGVEGAVEYRPGGRQLELLLVIAGEGTLAGERFAAGTCFAVPAACGAFGIEAEGGVEFLRSAQPVG